MAVSSISEVIPIAKICTPSFLSSSACATVSSISSVDCPSVIKMAMFYEEEGYEKVTVNLVLDILVILCPIYCQLKMFTINATRLLFGYMNNHGLFCCCVTQSHTCIYPASVHQKQPHVIV